ncbi:MAG TPA: hypothetical protein VHC46_09805 [Thermodesulfobacteriota bacterium]|nr:hypothetical protein [Candidatus Paceibacterota bacterium]HVY56037.1 hypothetical protein [Thermodesulfobacteriota bacterium]
MKTYGTKFVISLVAFVALIGAIFAYVSRSGGKAGALTDTEASSTPVVAENPSDAAQDIPRTGRYKDGTYSARGTYQSPGGLESVDVTLVLKNDVITDASVVSNATIPQSIMFQGKFISGFKALVVGKNIDTVKLDKVSGSSLTPKGFNSAVTEIKAEAAA